MDREPTPTAIDPIGLIRPRRKIDGASAVLLPFDADGSIDWPGFDSHLARTAGARLTPAVNMDTGHVAAIGPGARLEALGRARSILGGGPFLAGAFVDDRPGSPYDPDAAARAAGSVAEHGGTPVVFPSFGLAALAEAEAVAAHAAIGERAGPFVAFELDRAFSPAGRIYGLDAFGGLLGLDRCVGLKHSSLRRDLEWARLAARDRLRPDFRLYTGNDLAIDMVMYGSDYLLGLSTFAPESFARRDALWHAGDPAFHELNDRLQYLGAFAFRPPVPAYKHSAAMFLRLCGRIATDRTHPDAPTRPDADRAVLEAIARDLGLIGGGRA